MAGRDDVVVAVVMHPFHRKHVPRLHFDEIWHGYKQVRTSQHNLSGYRKQLTNILGVASESSGLEVLDGSVTERCADVLVATITPGIRCVCEFDWRRRAILDSHSLELSVDPSTVDGGVSLNGCRERSYRKKVKQLHCRMNGQGSEGRSSEKRKKKAQKKKGKRELVQDPDLR